MGEARSGNKKNPFILALTESAMTVGIRALSFAREDVGDHRFHYR